MLKVAKLYIFDIKESFGSPWVFLSWFFFGFQFYILGQLISRLIRPDLLPNYFFYYGSGLLLIIMFNSGSWAGRAFVEGAHEGRLKYLLSLPITRAQLFLERIFMGVTINLFQLSIPLAIVLWVGGLLTPIVLLASIATVAVIGMGVSSLMVSLSFVAFKSFDIYNAIVAALSALLIRFSTVFYPIVFMPEAYKTVSFANPLTYGADLLRHVFEFDVSILLDANLAITAIIALTVGTMFFGMWLVARAVEGVKTD